jgi:hypothetical protein
MASFADALSGGNNAKNSSFMPKSYKKSSGAGVPSYLDNMGTAGASYTPPPAPAATTSPAAAAAAAPNAAAAPTQFAAPAINTQQPNQQDPSPSSGSIPRDTTTGMPSYMDKVATSYVAGTDRLEKLKKEIAASSMDSTAPGATTTSKIPPADVDANQDYKAEKKEATGLPSFFSSFFKKGKKKTPETKKASSSPARWEETADGSLSQQPKQQQNQPQQGLPHFLSQTPQGSTAAAQTSSSNTGGTDTTQKVETDMPTITSWAQTPEGSIHGFIYGSPSFEDGAYIITTPVGKGALGGSIVTTASGSKYRLSMDKSDFKTPPQQQSP